MIAEEVECVCIRTQSQALAQRFLNTHTITIVANLDRVGHRGLDPAPGGSELVVIDHQRPLVPRPVRVGKHVLVDVALRGKEIVQQKVLHLGEQAAAVQQREYLPLVALHQVAVGLLIPVGAPVLHAVLFGKALDLAVAEHGQAGQGGHQGADAKVLVPFAKLGHGRFLVGVVHEIDEPLQDLGVEFERVLDDRAVLGIVLVPQHVHKGAVVDPVHAQRAHKVALHQPEGLGQQQGVGRFGGHAVHHLPPELDGHGRVELSLGQAVLGPGGDGPAACPALGTRAAGSASWPGSWPRRSG